MSTFDTVVIGAGMSGLTSARMLADAGQRVVVLEGRDRIGGRMHTDRSAGFPVDLGASWIHGIENSPLWDLVHALRIPAIEYTVGSFQVGGRPIENYDGEGRRLDEAATAQWVSDVDLADRLLVEEIAASSSGDTYLDVTERALDRSGLSPIASTTSASSSAIASRSSAAPGSAISMPMASMRMRSRATRSSSPRLRRAAPPHRRRPRCAPGDGRDPREPFRSGRRRARR